MCATWRIHICDMTFLCVWHDSFMCLTWLIHVSDMTHSCVWRDSFMCVTWLSHMCDVTHSCVWRDSFMCVTWLIHVCDVTSRLLHTCDMTRVHFLLEALQLFIPAFPAFIWETCLLRCATWLIHMTHAWFFLEILELFFPALICKSLWRVRNDSFTWHDSCLLFPGNLGIIIPCIHIWFSLICAKWIIDMGDMTHWQDSCLHFCWKCCNCLPLNSHVRLFTLNSHVRHQGFLNMCDMTNSHVSGLNFSGSVGIFCPAFTYDSHWYVRNASLTWFMPAFFWKRLNSYSTHSCMIFVDMCEILR